LVALALSALSACDGNEASDTPPVPTVTQITAGSLGGSGLFTYKCTSAGDAFCSDNGLFSGGVPVIAVGGEAQFLFHQYKGQDGDAPVPQVSANDRLQFLGDGKVKALREGTAAVLGADGVGGKLVDALNVKVAPRANVKLEALTGKLGFRVYPVNAAGTPLGGAFPCKWTIDDANVARITTDPASTVVVLDIGSNGRTTLHLAYDDITNDIPVEVNR